MSYTSTVAAPAQYPQQMMPQGGPQATYQSGPAAPVSGPTYMSDAYRSKLTQQAPVGAVPATAPKKDNYSVINKTDLMLGAAGAVGGFFLAGIIGVTGPIGALILGLALLGMSAGVRAIKHNSDKKQQQQQPQAMQPGFQQYNYQQPQFQNQYPQTSMAPNQQVAPQYINPAQAPQVPASNMAYQQAYQQYPPQQGQVAGQPQVAYPQQYAGVQQNQSMWDKFLSWL